MLYTMALGLRFSEAKNISESEVSLYRAAIDSRAAVEALPLLSSDGVVSHIEIG